MGNKDKRKSFMGLGLFQSQSASEDDDRLGIRAWTIPTDVNKSQQYGLDLLMRGEVVRSTNFVYCRLKAKYHRFPNSGSPTTRLISMYISTPLVLVAVHRSNAAQQLFKAPKHCLNWLRRHIQDETGQEALMDEEAFR